MSLDGQFEYVCASKVNVYIILTGVPVAPDGGKKEGLAVAAVVEARASLAAVDS